MYMDDHYSRLQCDKGILKGYQRMTKGLLNASSVLNTNISQL